MHDRFDASAYTDEVKACVCELLDDKVERGNVLESTALLVARDS